MIRSGNSLYPCRPIIDPRLCSAGIMTTIPEDNWDMLDDVSPAALTISFVIAVALYVVTYLSFVRLLRYPRNWLPPSLPISLTTAGLVTITVTYVSVSSDGLDPAALVVSAGIIAVLFSIIAAPAVAFRPASRWVEFLAKHGDYAGLWMLAPAIAAAYAVPNVKLQGVLAAAMVIELAWFLRHRPNERRRLYPIGGHDLSILKAQAKGDLEGFARKHGIHELVLSDGTVNWRGCGKNTLPCPFNLYVNSLGLNTAPCCREHLAELCHYVAACLRDMEVVHWLEGGNLLGAVRESGRLLAWEDDVDLSVVLDKGRTFEQLAAGLSERGARDGYFVDVFKKMEFIAISYDRPRAWPFSWKRNRMRGEIRLDLAIDRHAVSFDKPVIERKNHKGAMNLTESGGYGVPQEIVLPTSTIAFLGGNIACPNQPKEYLRLIYGDFGEVVYTCVDVAAAQRRCRADTAAKRNRNLATRQ